MTSLLLAVKRKTEHEAAAAALLAPFCTWRPYIIVYIAHSYRRHLRG
jgi:hypothetical protein